VFWADPLQVQRSSDLRYHDPCWGSRISGKGCGSQHCSPHRRHRPGFCLAERCSDRPVIDDISIIGSAGIAKGIIPGLIARSDFEARSRGAESAAGRERFQVARGESQHSIRGTGAVQCPPGDGGSTRRPDRRIWRIGNDCPCARAGLPARLDHEPGRICVSQMGMTRDLTAAI
jgi:hypothetical protein